MPFASPATADHQLLLARAQAIHARGHALPPQGVPGDVIVDSWVRCMRAGLDVAAPPDIRMVEAADLARRREQAETVRRLALAELETLAQQIAGSNFLLAFADRDGVILDLLADNRFRMSGPGAAIQAGSHWDESRCGTNGLGTALAAGRSVAVGRLEHSADFPFRARRATRRRFEQRAGDPADTARPARR